MIKWKNTPIYVTIFMRILFFFVLKPHYCSLIKVGHDCCLKSSKNKVFHANVCIFCIMAESECPGNSLCNKNQQLRGSLLNYWHAPSRQKRKISSSTSDLIILICSLWGSNPSLDRLNQDWKKGNNSTFERNLNVALTPWSTSLWVKTAIPCVFSLNLENRGE